MLSSATEADGDLVCQAGARWEDINHALHEKGIPLFFPVSEFMWFFYIIPYIPSSWTQVLVRYV